MQQYAAGHLEASRRLVYAGCRYSFYLLSLVSIPLIINIDYILKLWLGIVPEYTSQFVVLSLLTSLLYVLSGSVTTAIQATGRIKWFQIGICIIMLFELPIAWILLRFGFPPYSVMWPSIATYFVAILFRFWLINRYVEGYHFSDYLIGVVLRCLLLFAIGYYISAILTEPLGDGLLNLIVSFVISVFIVSCIYFIFGINTSERKLLMDKIKICYGKK